MSHAAPTRVMQNEILTPRVFGYPDILERELLTNWGLCRMATHLVRMISCLCSLALAMVLIKQESEQVILKAKQTVPSSDLWSEGIGMDYHCHLL